MPRYAEEILATVTELQRHPTAEQVFMEMKKEHPSIAIVGFAGPIRPNGTARSPDLQPVRENRGCPTARYAGADPGGAGAGDPLLRP